MDYKTEPMDIDGETPKHLHTPDHKPRFDKKLLVIVGAVLVVLLVGGLAFFLLQADKKPDKANQQTSNQEVQEEEGLPAPAPDAADPVVFKSTTLNIEFTHRKDWTVKESNDKKQVTVTSPKFTYQTKDGESKTGVFTLKVGMGANEATQETLTYATAVKDALLIGYDAPTEAQRHYTNISYAGQEQENAFRFFLVTGSQASKMGTAIGFVVGESDFLIVGGYGTDKDDSLSFDAVPEASVDSEAMTQAIDIVKSFRIF